MFYTIVHSPEYKLDCKRCGSPLVHAVQFISDGELVTVGRECAKHYGIIWTAKIGPLADDPEMFQRAIEVWMGKKADYPRYRWPGGWSACQPVKDALGSRRWNEAKMIAHQSSCSPGGQLQQHEAAPPLIDKITAGEASENEED